MYRVLQILTDAEIAECRRIAAAAPFVDGRITNPHMTAKQNEQLHDAGAYQQSSELIRGAMLRSPEFMEFAFPVSMAPPMMTRYKPGMKYGAHADAAFIQLPGATIRSDLSCTIFLNDPEEYEGGELHVRLGDADLKFKLQPGEAIVYPSTMLHEVRPVRSGQRLVSITFIESMIADEHRRTQLYELNEVAALEGLKMDWQSRVRLDVVRQNLLRMWGEG